MWHITKGIIVSTRKLKSYWLFSSMLVIIIFLVAVITFSVFYKIPFNGHVLPVYSAIMGIEDSGKANVEKEFQKQWFRMQRARIDWKSMLIPCYHVNSVKDKSRIGYGKINETSIPKSFVEYMNIRPAGQFSQVFIRTKTNDDRNKTIGGDFWMVIFSGPANVSATVFDHGNGTYEATALLLDPGNYTIIAIIERSLCEGHREPETSLFATLAQRYYVGTYNTSEKHYPLPEDPPPYLWGRLNNKEIQFHVVKSQDDVQKRLRSVLNYQPCTTSCKMIWSGHGRWIKKNWKPYLDSDDHEIDLEQFKKKGRHNFETLYFTGDSTNMRFAKQYYHRKQLCEKNLIWKRCLYQMDTLFPKYSISRMPKVEGMTFAQQYGNVSDRIRIDTVLDRIRNVSENGKGMKSSRSLLVLHYNTHLPKFYSFDLWKKLIDEMVVLLKNSSAKILWKTVTAVGYVEARYQFMATYHTAVRVRLFAAYALSQMCKAGFDILDIYPMSASTLVGARDRVHFHPGVFAKSMEALSWWYLSNDTHKTQNICFQT